MRSRLWSSLNDTAELHFKDEAHIGRVFGSQYTRDVVGPDGRNSNDFAATIAMFADEKLVHGAPVNQGEEQALVVLYYLDAVDRQEPRQLAKDVNPAVISAFGGFSKSIIANVSLPDPGNMLRYFQAPGAPTYSSAYQVHLQGKDDIPAFRVAQRQLETSLQDTIKVESASVLFGVRSVVYDQTSDTKFDTVRQPRLSGFTS
ncbi:hypothetical protein LTR86_010598 [Recurvomyces mirabilis]|nr:hypothetical protein LTR86_010598 [Recurvomyces mirabilis]